ncbi:hypothetical protein FF125_07855 [Aureibaculum algae]|uniref:Protein kinase domain-containing protein n=1 Tax=Aureibaculum algae TaxID=2584122 RepID=A0A5B7TN81_9FLAO|nr:serine/threonine-protein kinase [Aureibaculum algae]QCX38349.1 hypothetical protein FF125_07855 [Aureibaculum algae]
MKLSHYEWDPEKDLIAEGASAEVFKAKDTNSQNRFVALKIYKEAVIKGTTGNSNQKKYTLEKEFHKIDGLSHTNIVSFYGLDYIQHSDAMGRSSSYPVIIMEYASEGTLHDLIKTAPSQKVIDSIIQDILKGVDYLHSEGVIHRDLKLGNVLVSKNRKGKLIAKITDFGISRDVLEDQTINQSLTEGVGTPHYMSPEQFFKRKFGLDGEISERTDIWAIGVVIYRLLTGKLPFGDSNKDYEQIRDAIVTYEPDYSSIPSRYKKGLMSCFQKKAEKRPRNLSELNQLFQIKEKNGTSDNQEFETVILPLDNKDNSSDLESEMETQIPTYLKKTKLEEKNEGVNQITKLQKYLVIIFGLINISGVIYFLFNENDYIKFYIISALYVLSTIYLIFCFLKEKSSLQFWKFLIHGFLLFIAIYLVILLLLNISNLDFQSFTKAIYFLVFHFLFIVWLSVKQLKINLYFKFRDELGLSLLITISILIYLASYWFPIYNKEVAVNQVVYLMSDTFLLFSLVPNIFFIAALLMFFSKRHTNKFKIILILFFSSLLISSIWWLFLNESKGYIGYFIGIHVQEFKAGYYLWIISIFIGFSAILYKSAKRQTSSKYYWPLLAGILILWSTSFMFKKSQSQLGFDFNNSLKNLNHSKLEKTLNNGADIKWNYNAMSNVIGKYSNENSNNVEQIVKTLILNGWDGASLDGEFSLQNAIQSNNISILKLILNTKAAKYINNEQSDRVSLLKKGIELDNPEMVELILKAGGKPGLDEKLFNVERSEKMIKVLGEYNINTPEISYFEDFEKGSKIFKSSSDLNNSWIYTKANGFTSRRFQFLKKLDDGKSSRKSALFNIDLKEQYTIEVETSSFSKGVEYGIVFDDTGDSFYIAAINDNYYSVYKYQNSKWTTLKQVPVSKRTTNVLKIIRNGNYVSCYLNEVLKIDKLYTKSFQSNKIGVIISNTKKNSLVQFDNVKVTGKMK